LAEPDLSVVVIAYNDVLRLPTAVRSALDQTLAGLEVLVVDDGSTDGTADVADRLATEDCRVRVVHLTENSGGCGTPRNVGVELARAPYVMFLDSDDEYERHACKNLLLAAERTGADLVTGLAERFAAEWRWTKPRFPHLYDEEARFAGIGERPELLYDLICTNKLYRRGFLAEAGLRFPEGVPYEDMLFVVQAYCAARGIAVIPNLVYRWASNPRQTGVRSISSRKHEIDNFRQRVAITELIDAHLARHSSAAVQTVQREKFLSYDLRMHLRQLALQDDAFRQEFLRIARDYLTRWPAAAFERAAPLDRLAAFLLLRGDVDALVALARFRDPEDGALPALVRGDGRVWWPSAHLDTEEGRRALDVTGLGLAAPDRTASALAVSVTGLAPDGSRLRVHGQASTGGDAPVPIGSGSMVLRQRGGSARRRLPVVWTRGADIGRAFRVEADLAGALPVDRSRPAWLASLQIRRGGQAARFPLAVKEEEVASHSLTLPPAPGVPVGARLWLARTRAGALSLQQDHRPVRPVARRPRPRRSGRPGPVLLSGGGAGTGAVGSELARALTFAGRDVQVQHAAGGELTASVVIAFGARAIDLATASGPPDLRVLGVLTEPEELLGGAVRSAGAAWDGTFRHFGDADLLLLPSPQHVREFQRAGLDNVDVFPPFSAAPDVSAWLELLNRVER